MNDKNLREITREIVSAMIFSTDNKLLMGRKEPAKGGVYSDCWHIPGGGVDEGEDNITTLKREVLEETNLDISEATIEMLDDQGRGASEKKLKPTGEIVWCKMNFNVYKVTLGQSSDEVQLNPSDDLIELKWFSISELEDIKLTPPSVELFTKLGYII